MNRIQSGDLKTFLSLANDPSGETQPFAFPATQLNTDEAELARLGAAQGVGYTLDDDDELRETFNELGVTEFIGRPES
jgi:hypothetical protein